MGESLTKVKRRISSSVWGDAVDVTQMARGLMALPGVIDVSPAASGKHICVSYDVAKLQYLSLIQALQSEGLLSDAGLSWWQRFKSSWYQDQDLIRRDNAKAKPAPCCSNPTEIIAQSRKRK